MYIYKEFARFSARSVDDWFESLAIVTCLSVSYNSTLRRTREDLEKLPESTELAHAINLKR